MTSLLQNLVAQATAPAPATSPQATQHHVSLQTAISQMTTQTPTEITDYCQMCYSILKDNPPAQATSFLLQYNETVRQGTDPAANTCPWYLAVINDKPQIITVLDITTPATATPGPNPAQALPNSSPAPAPPSFPPTPPFTTKPLLMTIGDRPTATDTWTHGAFTPDELFGTTAKPQATWSTITKITLTQPLDHLETKSRKDTTVYNIVPLRGQGDPPHTPETISHSRLHTSTLSSQSFRGFSPALQGHPQAPGQPQSHRPTPGPGPPPEPQANPGQPQAHRPFPGTSTDPPRNHLGAHPQQIIPLATQGTMPYLCLCTPTGGQLRLCQSTI